MRVDMDTRHCKLRVESIHSHLVKQQRPDLNFRDEYEKQTYVHVGSERNRQYYGKYMYMPFSLTIVSRVHHGTWIVMPEML